MQARPYGGVEGPRGSCRENSLIVEGSSVIRRIKGFHPWHFATPLMPACQTDME